MRALPPGSTIGILGGGQLGRMLSMAAAEIGYHVHIYTPEEDSPAAEVSRFTTVADYANEAALERFAEAVDVVTLEFENVPVATVEQLARRARVHPAASVLEITQHRVREKEFVRSCGIGTASFAPVHDEASLQAAAQKVGFPAILKTCRLGYDGKGQARIDSAEMLQAAWRELGQAEAILEGRITFRREISVIVARNAAGETAAFAPTGNEHRGGILHESRVPSGENAAIERRAVEIARMLAERLGVIGLLAVEMFVTEGGELLVNELAPRPHNSGHWTIEAAPLSQFHQAIRAVAGLPLASVEAFRPARMRNLIGEEVGEAEAILRDEPAAHLHLYGKAEARPGRKMGHVTYVDEERDVR